MLGGLLGFCAEQNNAHPTGGDGMLRFYVEVARRAFVSAPPRTGSS